MLTKSLVVGAVASLMGLLILAVTCSYARADGMGQGQMVLTCNNDGLLIGPNASTVVTCETAQLNLSSFRELNVEYVDIDGQANSPDVIINSIEATMNVNNGDGLLEDFMDVAFSPYINATGGGGIVGPPENYSTYGGTQSPHIRLNTSTIYNWISSLSWGPALGAPTNITFEAQVFVTNTGTSNHLAYNTLRVIVDTGGDVHNW